MFELKFQHGVVNSVKSEMFLLKYLPKICSTDFSAESKVSGKQNRVSRLFTVFE